jgi:putative endonuclease
MFIVYAIISESNKKVYIGQTVNITERLKQHNEKGENHIGQFTKQNKGPWKLIYKEEYYTRIEALKREKQLKSYRGRQFIKNLITHP